MASKKNTKLPKRLKDIRIELTKSMFTELNDFWNGPKKGTILEGRLDKKGNFRCNWVHPVAGRKEQLTIYPTHFKVLGRFYFRKA